MLHRIDHAIVAVRDLEAAAATYTQLLGRLPSWRGHHPQLNTANALFRLDNTYIELLAPAGDGPFADLVSARLRADGEGLFALAFGTDDADACAVQLRARGIAATDPVDGQGRDDATKAERRWRTVFLPAADTRGVNLFAIEHVSPPDALPATAPLGNGAAVITGVDHFVVMTADADAARTLYGDQLGLRLALDRSFEARGVRLLFFRLGGVTLECAAQLGAAAAPDVPDRLWGISYRVSDVAAACARLSATGFDVSEVRTGHRPGTRVCTVRRETCGVATLLIGPDGDGANSPAA